MDTNDRDLIMRSLERCAERAGDIAPIVYGRWLDDDPAVAELMRLTDEYMRGRMLEQVIEALLDPATTDPGGYIGWEYDNHRAYGATAVMYRTFLKAFVGVVQEASGNDWNGAEAAAWSSRVAAVLAAVDGRDAD